MGDGASSSRRGGRGGGRASSKGETVVSDLGRRKISCGYCKSPGSTSFCHGLWAYNITVDDYQDLLDRGWRRSGSYIYKPDMEKTCCPSYTIRLKAADFAPSKEQERVLKRVQRFLDGTLDVKKSDQFKDEKHSPEAVCSAVNCAFTNPVTKSSVKREDTKDDENIHYISKRIDDAVNACVVNGDFSSTAELPKSTVKKLKPQLKKKLTHISEEMLYTSNISFQIAAMLKRYQMSQGLDCKLDESHCASSQNGDFMCYSSVVVAEKLAHIINLHGDVSGMMVNACNGYLNFYLVSRGVEMEAANTVTSPPAQPIKDHGGSGKSCRLASAQRHRGRKLEIHMRRSRFDPEEYELYRKYQIAIHKDKPAEVAESQFYRFLVETPLIFVPCHTKNGTIPTCGFGSFHQQYRIDGKLVAVGVVDVLPRCLSSKYLFWDPELAFLSLGKYSALKEIEWVKRTAANCSNLQYYYLGYYIHSCNKMRYKAAYGPSELLCPLRHEWVPFTIARPLLDKRPYVVLSDYASLQSEAASSLQLLEGSSQLEWGDFDRQGRPGDEDDEMDIDCEDREFESDEESDSEIEIPPVDVSNVMLELDGSRMKFKDLKRVAGPLQKSSMDALERQLRRYAGVVGRALADRVVYMMLPLGSP